MNVPFRLSEYLDGELSPEDVPRCEAHLQQCAACQSELRELRQVVVALRQASERTLVSPVSSTWIAIARKMERQHSHRAPVTRTNISMATALLGAALLFLLGIVTGFWLASRSLKHDTGTLRVRTVGVQHTLPRSQGQA